MAKPDNQFAEMAVKAADRIDRDRAMGKQLALIPDAVEPQMPTRTGAGRPPGARNKGSSQLRKWLAEQGLKMPEQQIAEIAGLASGNLDALGSAMAQAERVIAWATDGKGEVPGKNATSALIAMRIDLFKFLYASMRQAADALMPYGTPKASPDVVVNQQTTVIVPAAPARAGDDARLVDGSATARPGRMAPPPMPEEIEQDQGVSNGDPDKSDAESRTE